MTQIKLNEAQIREMVKAGVKAYLKESEEEYPFQLHSFEYEAYCPYDGYNGEDRSVYSTFTIYAPDREMADEIANTFGLDRFEDKYGEVGSITFKRYREEDDDSTETFFDMFYDKSRDLYNNLYDLNDYLFDYDSSYSDNGPDPDWAYDNWKDNQ